MLLFADDMAIIGKTPEETQILLDRLYNYSNSWGLRVNTSKTKIMVFRKRGGLLPTEHWTYNDQPIEVVNEFNYLGTVFSYTGSYGVNIEHVVGKALKALNVLLCKCSSFDLKPKVLCQLFDSLVTPILSYSSEIWGFTKSKEIERIHLKFCKRLLKVKQNTCSAGVYGELGRYPLYIQRYVRIIKYWFNVLNTENIILRKIYDEALTKCQNGCRNWVYGVKQLLNNYGFSYVFDDVHAVDVKTFITTFRCRLIDCFKQEWFRMLDSPVLFMYKEFKTELGYEKYLDILPRSFRFYFCRLRLSVHPLRMQTGRYARNHIVREERYCLCCNERDLEDEYHFVCVCPCFNATRRKYLKRLYYVNPSVHKFISLITSNNKNELVKLSLFVKEALSIRKDIINVEH
jgi:hypothetical protein